MIALYVTVPSGALEYEGKHVRQVLRSAGAEVSAVARSLIRASVGGGRTYRLPGGGTYVASAPGQPPVNRTGVLSTSFRLRTFHKGHADGVSIRSRGKGKKDDFYSLFLEMGAKGGGRRWRNKPGAIHNTENARIYFRGDKNVGTGRVLLPRPFLSVALGSRAASLTKRIGEAASQGIKFVRQKP